MTREDISDAMAHIGDDLLEEADAARGTGGLRRSRWRSWAALAACAGAVLFGAVRWGGGDHCSGRDGAACCHPRPHGGRPAHAHH